MYSERLVDRASSGCSHGNATMTNAELSLVYHLTLGSHSGDNSMSLCSASPCRRPPTFIKTPCIRECWVMGGGRGWWTASRCHRVRICSTPTAEQTLGGCYCLPPQIPVSRADCYEMYVNTHQLVNLVCFPSGGGCEVGSYPRELPTTCLALEIIKGPSFISSLQAVV